MGVELQRITVGSGTTTNTVILEESIDAAYNAFLNKYMVLGNDGVYTRNSEMWVNTGTKDSPNWEPKKNE